MAISKETMTAYKENAKAVKSQAKKTKNNTKKKQKAKPLTAIQNENLSHSKQKHKIELKHKKEGLKQTIAKNKFQRQAWQQQIVQGELKNTALDLQNQKAALANTQTELKNQAIQQKMDFDKENHENKLKDRQADLDAKAAEDTKKKQEEAVKARNKKINMVMGSISGAISEFKNQFLFRSSKRFFGK